MSLKQYARYQMDFQGRWGRASAVLMGLSFFLRIVYYFGLTNLTACGTGEVIFFMILPILLCGMYIVLHSALKWNAPGIYGILGAAMCILLIIWSFSSASFLRIFLSVIIYAFAGIVLLATVGGYLPGRLLASVLFMLPLIYRVFFLDMGKLGIFEWFLETSVLSMLAALFGLTRCIKEVKNKPSDK